MSRKHGHTNTTGGGSHWPASQEKKDTIPQLTTPVLSKVPITTSNARQIILEAVEILEKENSDLRKLNSKLLAENENLKNENDRLRKQFEYISQQNNATLERNDVLEDQNNKLQRELEKQAKRLNEEAEQKQQLEDEFYAESEKFRKDMQIMEKTVSNKDEEIKDLESELDTLRKKLDRSSSRNFNDRDIELLHELDLMKAEKSYVLKQKEETDTMNTKLKNELKNLETQMEQKAAELRNENRRHTLLTKEFNSLLEENNHLKLQLRRRQPTTSSGIAYISEREITVSIEENNPNVRRLHTSPPLRPGSDEDSNSPRSSSSSRLPTPQAHPNSRSSRDVPIYARDLTFDRSRRGSQSESRRSSQTQQSQNRPYAARPDAARPEGRTTPEPLPSLASAGKNWRP